MIKRIYSFIAGSQHISVSCNEIGNAADVLMQKGINCLETRISQDGGRTYILTASNSKKALIGFEEAMVGYTVSKVHGLPYFIKFLIMRPGIAVGILLFLLVNIYLSGIIWRIDIKGCQNVSKDEIIESLEELGCGYGSSISQIDFDTLHAKFLAENEKIAWISVNMRGSHAYVELIEAAPGKNESIDNGIGANIVAKEDGQIYLCRPERGALSVTKGDVVKRGDILISGVIPMREDRLRFDYASGEVLAYVNRTVEVRIPFEREVKIHTGREKQKKSLKIFKKNINLFIKGGFEYTTYDKIEERVRLYLFGYVPLPIWYNTDTYREYEYKTVRSSPENAVSLAMIELRDETDKILEECEIVSNRISHEITDSEYIIRCNLVCITNIAKSVEFSYEDLDKTETDT